MGGKKESECGCRGAPDHRRYQRKGFRVAVMCFRSCSGEDNLTLRAYHLGFTEDLELVCKTLRERWGTGAVVTV
ncbi:unnamed protein product [Hapterophycus canaliculatus]